MKRFIYKNLIKWKQLKHKKPLIIEGARQVGKTYIVKEFGKNEYKKFAYFNFDNNKRLKDIFDGDFDTDRILLLLSAEIGFKIDEETLIFLDEIQECNNALTSLKYFCEEKDTYSIIVAGSLLGLSYNSGTGFPVGKVNFLKLYPLTFREFLMALKEDILVDLINKKDYISLKNFKDKLNLYLRIYNFVGGMPEVVKNFVENKDFTMVKKIQSEILNSYDKDFSKHAVKDKIEKIRLIFNGIPSELAKDNKKFMCADIKKGSRLKDYEYAIKFLKEAGLIYIVYNINKFAQPLKSYIDSSCFKIYLFDVGLLSNMNHVNEKSINDEKYIFEEFKGQLAEQYVICQLVDEYGDNIFYYRDESGRLQLDFIIEKENKVCPIEVKSGINLKSTSLNNIIEKEKLEYAIRYSMADYKKNAIIEDIPLYML